MEVYNELKNIFLHLFDRTLLKILLTGFYIIWYNKNNTSQIILILIFYIIKFSAYTTKIHCPNIENNSNKNK